ncbi:MAG TPA: hypothetical protein DCE02_01375, partial [Ruminiclostridium sp.]|nr:hypothetical protein [Ruminiclostridium sp.]
MCIRDRSDESTKNTVVVYLEDIFSPKPARDNISNNKIVILRPKITLFFVFESLVRPLDTQSKYTIKTGNSISIKG